jgi:nitrilase
MKIGVIQMNSVSDVAANIGDASALIDRCVELERPDWISMPEHWNWAGGSTAEKIQNADDPIPTGKAYKAASDLARRHGVWVHAGSLMERSADGRKLHNTTVVFDRQGREVAVYRKIHLFDVSLPDGMEYKESASVLPGRSIVTYHCEGLQVGCAICYDLRFPELFQGLTAAGAEMIVLPSAFTLQTGKDHWEVLCRARAIETQTYFVAPGQTGYFLAPGNERRYTYGHSLVADPWGHVVAKASDGVGFITARIDKAYIAACRAQIPVAKHKVIGRAMPPVAFAAE